jgi:hypothetical protein
VKDAINNGVISVDEPYFASSNDTPLFWAVITNNVELATFLLEKGANVNFQQAKVWSIKPELLRAVVIIFSFFFSFFFFFLVQSESVTCGVSSGL